MKTKILLADDDPDIIKLLALRLRANDFEVIEAIDGMQALAKAHRDHPDLIVLDILMPAGNGIAVHKNLKLSYDTSMIPIIFITAQTSGDIKEKVLGMGANDFIAKPFQVDELIEKIRHVLQEKLCKEQYSENTQMRHEEGMLMKKKILLVDDDPDMLKIISFRLKKNNYNVIVACDGVQAVQKAHQEKPDLIILDVMLPAGSGISVYDKLKKSTDTWLIPVIFITAAGKEIQKNIADMGVEAVITKPFEIEVLLKKIREMVSDSA